MEKFIMESLRMQEMQQLRLQADEHAIPAEEVEELESEHQEIIDDEALIEYITQREKLEEELDQLLD